ncbi:hypothetical protein [Amycolatopsis sp.]|uniref:hypothetical protein n=1 Tax=Amycolatopsis sp. TaxID=37632 RepID=UPI002E04F257|nr:hypothetical protein [Amycolatopsis sp.]
MDSGRAISFVTLGTRDLPTLRSFYRSWGWTERDGGDDESPRWASRRDALQRRFN